MLVTLAILKLRHPILVPRICPSFQHLVLMLLTVLAVPLAMGPPQSQDHRMPLQLPQTSLPLIRMANLSSRKTLMVIPLNGVLHVIAGPQLTTLRPTPANAALVLAMTIESPAMTAIAAQVANPMDPPILILLKPVLVLSLVLSLILPFG